MRACTASKSYAKLELMIFAINLNEDGSKVDGRLKEKLIWLVTWELED